MYTLYFGAFHSYYQASGVLQSGLQGRSAGTDLWPAAGPQAVLWQFSQGKIINTEQVWEAKKSFTVIQQEMKHWCHVFMLNIIGPDE